MGTAEILQNSRQLIITAHIVLYGSAASEVLAKQVASNIEDHWNEPAGKLKYKGYEYAVLFRITGSFNPLLQPHDIYENDDPLNNYYRIEEQLPGNISFVDGINSNTGMFQWNNLQNNSTTAAHEFGHGLGLDHPQNLDIRGTGIPGIMYPRGTLVDPEFQYDPAVPAGSNGGTLNPFLRKVLQSDIDDLMLNKLHFNDEGKTIVGDFSSVWHEALPIP